MASQRISCAALWLAFVITLPATLHAQQTGVISGKVVATDGAALPGVTVEARSNVLPAPRVTVSDGIGDYRLPALPPGTYEIKFVLSGMADVTRQAEVQLGQETRLDATMGVQGVSETVEVTATATLIDKETAGIKSGVSSDQIQQLPVGQEYRDLIKLIPGVMYTQDTTRGPSAGGSGQDNVYNMDGVNVTLPLFGTLSSEPASYDIAQVTTIKGGARAVDFDRAGGFTIDTVSKSGTNRYAGQFSFQFQPDSWTAEQTVAANSRYLESRTWLTVNGGGPILPNKAYFYGSYYRPERTRNNQSNLYGELPKYESTRNEAFGKGTVTPTGSTLFNVSYRWSHRLDTGSTFGQATAPTAGSGAEIWQRMLNADGSWVINAKSFANFKYTHFENPNLGRPDNVADVKISLDPGTRLDVGNLDKIGQLSVPTPVAGATDYNAFVQPLIDRYGYVQNGQKLGGGTVGYGTDFNDQSFYRDAVQVGYNLTLGTTFSHELHAGYQFYVDSEKLKRYSNGWGLIRVPGGRQPSVGIGGVAAYYYTEFYQQSLGTVPTIDSSYRSHNLEINDTMRWHDWTFNAGLLMSNDRLYGQGLREDPSTISGFVAAPGNKYEMHEVTWGDTLQPRLGATWAYNGRDTIYGSYARYVPAASSLPRAASWARNLAVTINAFFDQNGVLYGAQQLASSSGKLFDDGLTPRTVDEYILGTAKQFGSNVSGRLYYRYRAANHFWEDTNNNARVAFNPPADIPRELYIPDLAAKLAQIGSGSSYVIAELDGAYTRYHEVTLESEWRAKKAFVRGSYTYSRYYGNMDQDNTTAGNDDNIFIGSSNIADGAGRQLWNFKDGTLRGDRPNMFKLYGYYLLSWNASAGGYFVAQSGQPWEIWSYEPYIALTTSTSDTARFAEKAGSRRTAAHYQLDLNYTQNIRLMQRLNFQVAGDLFNVFDKQTGYNVEPRAHSAGFLAPRSYYAPRRFQLAARVQF